MLAAITLIAYSMNLYTYSRIIHEQNVAEIVFAQIDPQYYTATLTYEDNNQGKQYTLRGDE